MQAKFTGRQVNVWGSPLLEIDAKLCTHDQVVVNGVVYYTHDYGGYIVGAREARRVDYGGNPHGNWRAAPRSLDGCAAPVGAIPCRIEFSAPEIVEAQ